MRNCTNPNTSSDLQDPLLHPHFLLILTALKCCPYLNGSILFFKVNQARHLKSRETLINTRLQKNGLWLIGKQNTKKISILIPDARQTLIPNEAVNMTYKVSISVHFLIRSPISACARLSEWSASMSNDANSRGFYLRKILNTMHAPGQEHRVVHEMTHFI